MKTRRRYHLLGPGRSQRSLHLVVGTQVHNRVQVSVTVAGPPNYLANNHTKSSQR